MSVARRKGIFGTGSSLSSRLLAGGRQNIAAEVKKQSGINGLLPALGAGPFHLFRLHLDLRCDVLKKVTVTFPSEKVFSQRRPFGSQTLVVAQCRGGNLPAGKHAKIRSAARYRESLAQFIVSQLDQFLLASSAHPVRADLRYRLTRQAARYFRVQSSKARSKPMSYARDGKKIR